MFTFGIIMFTVLTVEFAYSTYKNDGKYPLKQTIPNYLTGILLQARTFLSTTYYVPFFFGIVIAFLPHNLYGTFTLPSYLACLLSLDFTKYCFHRTEHSVAWLWMLHFVHHSDYKVNVGTSTRASPFEVFFFYICFIPLVVVGFPIQTIFLSLLTISIYEVFVHDPYIKFPKFLEYVFISPNAHLIHHDQEPENYNMNFGAIFSIWDRAFGTYRAEIPQSIPGIKGYHQDNFVRIHIDPIVDYFSRLVSKNKA